MTKEELRKIISQIKKYDIVEYFDNEEEVDKWLSGLNEKQIKNFIGLDISPSEIVFPTWYLIDSNLLNCDDYSNRVKAMSKIKNVEGCAGFLCGHLCSPNFLNSKNYYKDLEKISRADTARYALSIIDEDAFINSPYHDEDLELIVTAKYSSDNNLDNLVADALATVAKDINSINGHYHREDMRLIANRGSECLLDSDALVDLAINEVSLNDKYHLENMEILSKAPIASWQLYEIMSDSNIIKGKYYRDEVNALVKAMNEITTLALYNYITNPDEINSYDYMRLLSNEKFDLFFNSFLLGKEPRRSGRLDTNYLDNLHLLNRVDKKFVLFVEMLLSNKDLYESGHQEEDIRLLLTVKAEDIFIDLCKLMSDRDSLFGKHHFNDAYLISETTDADKRRWLLAKATDENSINSVNHRFDMQYIVSLNLGNLDGKIRDKMYYYLFSPNGIKDIEHIWKLEQLREGKIIDKNIVILEYLNKLEEGFEEVIAQEKSDIEDIKKTGKGFARVRKLFGRR